MALYSLAELANLGPATFPLQEIISGTNVGFTIKEWGFGINGAPAGSTEIGIGIPLSPGLGPAKDNLIAEDPGNTATAQTTSAVNWGGSPTSPAVYSRQIYLPGIIGAGVLLAFPRPYTILKGGNSTTLVLLTGNNPLDTWIVVDE
jgi:hypothetical protein